MTAGPLTIERGNSRERETLTVFDNLGRPVRRIPLAAGAAREKVSLADLSPGLYYLRTAGTRRPLRIIVR